MPIDEAEKAQILFRLERLRALIGDLEQAAVAERPQIRDRMRGELESAKELVRALRTHDRA